MYVGASTRVLLPKSGFALTAGTAGPTTAAVQYPAEADEPAWLVVKAGALTGTTPGFTVEVQTQNTNADSSSDDWFKVFLSGTIGTNGLLTAPLQFCAGKYRIVVTKSNIDNAGTPAIEILTRTAPQADTTP